MENTEQITIITTLRVDSSERQRNMDAVLRYLQPTGIRVLVLEADRENLYTTWKDFENVDFCFVYDEDPVFYRTHYLNRLLKRCTTPVVAVWDAEMILPYKQIDESLDMIMNGKAAMVIPYDQTVLFLSEEQTVASLRADSVIVQDFPLRGKKVFLNIRRRRWLLKKHNEYISRNWRISYFIFSRYHHPSHQLFFSLHSDKCEYCISKFYPKSV